jgi:hypothetical protein
LNEFFLLAARSSRPSPRTAFSEKFSRRRGEEGDYGWMEPGVASLSMSVVPLPPLDTEDHAMVQALADELHALPIASRGACLSIARDMFDAGCLSLRCLSFVDSIQELQAELGTLKNVQLSNLQLRKLVQWAQQQRQPSAANSDIGSKRPYPASFTPHNSSQSQLHHRPPDKQIPILTFASAATIVIQQSPGPPATAAGSAGDAAAVVGARSRAFIASDAAADLAQSLAKSSLEFHHDSDLAEAEGCNMEQERGQEQEEEEEKKGEEKEEEMEEDEEEEEEKKGEEKEEEIEEDEEEEEEKKGEKKEEEIVEDEEEEEEKKEEEQPVVTDDPHVSGALCFLATSTHASSAIDAPASSFVPAEEELLCQFTANEHNFHFGGYQQFMLDDFDLHQLKKISKMSDWELCNAYWGRDSGLCSTSKTLVDHGEGDLKEGETVFVLQLDWGDDSVGAIRNRLEAKVVEVGRGRHSSLVHVK